MKFHTRIEKQIYNTPSCSCSTFRFLPRTGKYPIISKLSIFSIVFRGDSLFGVPCKMSAVSFSENTGPSSIDSGISLLSGHAFWQYKHPTRQLCQEGFIQWGISPWRSLWKVRHRSALSKKRSAVIAPVGQAFIQALQFSQRSSICGACHGSCAHGRSEIKATSR